jgi:hypothetical protein
MGWACSSNCGIRILVKDLENRQHGRTGRRQKNNIKRAYVNEL